MFSALIDKFMNFSSRFTYRGRFFFWVFLYFSFTPIPAYWILETQGCALSRANLQMQGNQAAQKWFAVFEAFTQYYVEWIHCIAVKEVDRTRLESFKSIVEETLEELKQLALVSKEKIIHRIGLFSNGSFTVNNLENVVLLETMWEQIKKNAEDENIEESISLFELCLERLTDKLHQIAYDYHIVLQTDPIGVNMARMIYFDSVQDQKLMARLGVKLETLPALPEADPEEVKRLLLQTRYTQRHLDSTRMALETAYRHISDDSPWKTGHHNDFQKQLSSCYKINYHLTSLTLEYLSGRRKAKINYLEFIQGINCLSKTRRNALTAFDEVLLKERNIYSLQTTLTWIYFICLGILLIVFLVFRFLTRHFIQMEAYIKGLSKGQFLSMSISHPEEEMGKIAKTLQDMGRSIEHIVHQLKALEKEVSHAGTEIEKAARDQSNATNVQDKFLITLHDNIGEIANKTQSLAAIMESFTQTAGARLQEDRGQEGLKSLLAKMKLLKTASDTILQTLANVHHKEQVTRSVITLMTKISDQASLLALNAAIEALNIGEYAQPFFDTTEKIQKFSLNTSTATLAIKKIVNEMAQSITIGRTTAESCVKEINRGANRVIEVSGQLNSIIGQDETQYNQFHVVNDMIQNQASLSVNITSSVDSLSRISADSKVATNDFYKSILELGNAATELSNVVDALYSRNGGNK